MDIKIIGLAVGGIIIFLISFKSIYDKSSKRTPPPPQRTPPPPQRTCSSPDHESRVYELTVNDALLSELNPGERIGSNNSTYEIGTDIGDTCIMQNGVSINPEDLPATCGNN